MSLYKLYLKISVAIYNGSAYDQEDLKGLGDTIDLFGQR